MKVLAFDVKSSVAHFRRPDTTATQLTYPFIPPTAAKGLVGAILGIEDFTTTDKVGIELRSSVRLVSQQLSLLHNGGSSFNRPTTIQLLVEPAYRIYYAGEQFFNELEIALKEKQFVYTTYLGSAFAITTPVYAGTWELNEVLDTGKTYSARSVIPVSAIKELVPKDGHYYQRASGFMKRYEGHRTFSQSIDFIFEKSGKKMFMKPKLNQEEYQLVEIEGDLVCLV
ncbi:CRISPR-associated protein Cas5 [Siminovitchia sp. FSL H7-0308]|uniref:CRISPR-associated protein Cas5 n=1 Tax=Siminovitchia sp. FSL H7-0308 TaxID=2921432 RepID=UPI0030EC352B